jgi:hypothetical protein
MKFTNRFVNKASDWLLNQTSQSNASAAKLPSKKELITNKITVSNM